MNSHLKRVLILLLIFTFVFQMAGVTSLSRVQAYADTETEEALDVSDADEAEDVTTEETDTESPGEIETDGENPPDAAAEEPADPEAASEETAEVPEETPADEETVTVEETVEEPAEEEAEAAEAEAPMLKAAGTKANSNGKTVLAFTSDIHNSSNNTARNRMNNWIANAESKYGDIEVFAFCGDMGAASSKESEFWTYTKAVMDAVSDAGAEGVYTTGNHEFANGQFATTTNAVKDNYIKDAQGYEGDNYRIYCLGTDNWNNNKDNVTDDQVDALTKYLEKTKADKPIFVLIHFPLHRLSSSRTTTNADKVIDALNEASGNGKTIFLLWGHNHSQSDPAYDQIYKPGYDLTYDSGKSKTIKFYYAAAGCMSDTEYVGSSSVKGKGLLVTIDNNSKAADATITMDYLTEDASLVTRYGDDSSATIEFKAGAESTTYTLTDELKADKEYLIATANNGSGYILSNEDGTATGSLKGYEVNIADGKITIDDTIPEANVAFSCVKDTASSDANSTWLEIDGKCLYMASQSNLSMADPVSGKYWHYIANDGTTDKNLLWFFQDSKDTTTNTYGYTWTGSTYRYYLQYSNDGEFTKGTLTSTTASLANTDTPKIYLFAKDDGSGSGGDDPVMPTETRYVETNAFEANKDYIIAVEKGNGEVYALKNAGSGSLDSEILVVYPADASSAAYVKTTDTNLPWSYTITNSTGSNIPNRTRLSNSSRYLTINSSSKALETDTNGYYVVNLDGSKVVMNYNNGTSTSGSLYYIACNDGTFASTAKGDSESAANIKLYVKTEVPTNPVALEGISIDETASVEVGQTKDLTVAFTPADATNKAVTWESSNPSVATVSNGTITGVSEGTVTITATASDGGFTDTCEVTVTKSTAPKYVEVTTLEDGREYIIGAANGNNSVYALKNVATSSSADAASVTLEVQPANGSNAAYIMTADTGVAWTYRSSDQNMLNNGFRLSLSFTGNRPRASSSNGYAVSFSNGTFKINNRNLTCSSGTFGTSSTSSATVRLFAKEVPEVPATGIALNTNSLNMEVSETETLTAMLTPSDATTPVVWTSNNEAVAIVANGVVTAVAGGTATITATAGNVSATCSVTVTEPDPTRYVEVSSLQEGKNYIVAVTKDNNTVYVIRNNSGSLATAELTVTKEGNEAAYIETGNASVVWLFNGGERNFMTQGTYYLNITNSGTARDLTINTTQAYGAGYADSHMYLQNYSATSGNKYYIAFNNGTFSATESNASANAATIRLFEEYDGSVYYNVTLPEGFEGAATVKEGANYTFTKSSDADEYNYGDVTYTMGGGASTPITADEDGVYTITNVTGDLVIYGTRTPKPATIYVLTDTLQPGKNYIIASGNSGTVHALTNSNNTIASTDITVSDNKISTNNKNIVFTTVGSGTTVDNIMNGERYLRISGTSGYGSPSLAISTTVGSDRPWAYSSDNKLTCTVSNTSYYIYYTNTFSITTSATGTNSREIYLFVEDDGTTPHEHTYGEPEYTWTATDNGYTCTATAVCTGCEEGTDGHSVTETVSATYAVTTAATCTAAGSGTYTATFTNTLFTVQTKNVDIPAIGHDMTHHAAVPATCTEDGTVEYWSCSVCGKNFGEEAGTTELKSIVAPATGHSMTHHAAVPATCTEDGTVEYWSCSKCEKNFSDESGTTELTNIIVPATDHNMTHHDAVAPTCTEAGTVEYWSCSKCKKNFSDEAGTTELTNIIVPATGHNMTHHDAVAPTCTEAGTVEYWSCSKCKKNFSDADGTTELTSIVAPATGHTMTHHDAVAPTCTEAGTVEYWSCSVCEKNFSDADGTTEITNIVAPATDHNWDTPTYTWADDNGHVTAKRVCKNNSAHFEEETVEATYALIQEATETTAGLERYTSAAFENPAFEVQIKEVSIPPTGYEVTYVWADNFSSVTATAVPYAQGADTVTEEGTITSAVTKEPTCTETGVRTYTATFENPLFSTQYKTEDIAAIDHDWNDPTYKWADDYTSVTATRTCKHDVTHVESETAEATGEITTPATCTDTGVKTWTSAAFTNTAFKAQTTTETIPAKGHDWQFVNFTWTGSDEAGYTAAAANYRCKNDSEHTKAIDLTVSSETTPATCETAGSTVYTATIAEADSPDGIAHTDTRTVVLPALEHDWEFVNFTWTGSDETGYTAAVANYKCKNNEEHTQTVYATVTPVTTDPTCEVAGSTVYTAAVTAADSLDETAHNDTKTVAIPATGHKWIKPAAWTWTGDDENGYTKVGGTFTCENDPEHVQLVETTEITAVKVDPTPTTAGSITYTAELTGPNSVVYEIQKEVTLPATGYTFKDPVYTWTKTADGYSVEALKECNEDHAQDITETVTASYAVTTAATCVTDGVGTYTAAFTNSAFVTQRKTETISATGHTEVVDEAVAPTCTETGLTEGSHCSVCGTVLTAQTTVPALGHDWKQPTGQWNADHTSVVLTFVCNRDASHTETVTASGSAISSEITTQPTATTPGVRTYSATVTLDGETYTVTDTEAIPATGATISGSITSYKGNTEEGQVTVQLFAGASETAAYNATVTNNTSYTFAGVAAGTYTMKVSKKDHVTRSYEITVDGTALTQDVKIHLLGDVNGDGRLTTGDVARTNSHVKEVQFLEGYEFECADVSGDGRLTTGDVARINSHVKEVQFLW